MASKAPNFSPLRRETSAMAASIRDDQPRQIAASPIGTPST